MNLKTGFENLDNVIGGLHSKDLIGFVSRPGAIKSTLAINIINNVSKQTNKKILYFNLETSKEQLKDKIINENARIIDKPRITIEEIKSKCEAVEPNGLGLIVIDYIQLIKPKIFNIDATKDIKNISQTLKTLAHTLNVPIIVLSQISRKQIENIDYFHLVLKENDH